MQFITQPTPLSSEVIDDRVATVLDAGTNITLTYDDAANVLTIDATPSGSGYSDEQAQDAVGNILQDSATIDYVYNDTTPYITGLVRDNSITESMLNLSDNTTKNSSTSSHGLLPKLPGDTTTFLRGDGVWIAPPTGTTYTDEQAQDAIASMLVAGANITLSYDDAANTLTITAAGGTSYTDEQAQDAVGTILVDTATIDFTYNDTTPSVVADVKDASITEVKLLLNDNTTQNSTVSKHGFLPKLSGTTTTFLRGDGTWIAPTAATDTEAVQDIVGNMFLPSSTVSFTYDDTGGTMRGNVVAITESQISLSDVTTANSLITRHGLLPKLSGNFESYMNGGGEWSVPTFLALSDTSPTSYIGNALKLLRVNAAMNAVEFGDVLGTIATQNANAVAITGGLVDNLTIARANGGFVYMIPDGFRSYDRAGNNQVSYDSQLMSAGGTGRYAVNCGGTAPSYFGGDVACATSIFATNSFVLNDSAGDDKFALYTTLNAAGGTGRFAVHAIGTAPSYFGGTVQVVGATLTLGATVDTTYRLDVRFPRATQHGVFIQGTGSDSGTAHMLFANSSAATVGSIICTASATAFNTSSDVRLKHAIATLTAALERVRALQPISFKWNADDSNGVGFLAHELQQIIPESVTGEPDAINSDGSIKPQQVDNSKLVPWLVAGMKELMTQVETLTARVAALEA